MEGLALAAGALDCWHRDSERQAHRSRSAGVWSWESSTTALPMHQVHDRRNGAEGLVLGAGRVVSPQALIYRVVGVQQPCTCPRLAQESAAAASGAGHGCEGMDGLCWQLELWTQAMPAGMETAVAPSCKGLGPPASGRSYPLQRIASHVLSTRSSCTVSSTLVYTYQLSGRIVAHMSLSVQILQGQHHCSPPPPPPSDAGHSPPEVWSPPGTCKE